MTEPIEFFPPPCSLCEGRSWVPFNLDTFTKLRSETERLRYSTAYTNSKAEGMACPRCHPGWFPHTEETRPLGPAEVMADAEKKVRAAMGYAVALIFIGIVIGFALRGLFL